LFFVNEIIQNLIGLFQIQAGQSMAQVQPNKGSNGIQ
jgi:hypothetical protein